MPDLAVRAKVSPMLRCIIAFVIAVALPVSAMGAESGPGSAPSYWPPDTALISSMVALFIAVGLEVWRFVKEWWNQRQRRQALADAVLAEMVFLINVPCILYENTIDNKYEIINYINALGNVEGKIIDCAVQDVVNLNASSVSYIVLFNISIGTIQKTLYDIKINLKTYENDDRYIYISEADRITIGHTVAKAAETARNFQTASGANWPNNGQEICERAINCEG